MVVPHLRQVEGYVPVEPPEALAAALGLSLESLVKVDANENPYGPSPKALEALARYQRYHIYPDPFQRRVRQALASYTGFGPEWLLAGAGSDELIDLLARLFVGPGDRVIDLAPTFGMYSVVARVCGGEVVEVARDDEFQVSLESVARSLDSRVKVIFLTNPNNPSGTLTPMETVKGLIETECLVVVDEAYFEFCDMTCAGLLREHRNLVVLRTCSKWMGLAGLRLGYGIMDPALVQRLMAIKNPYNVNAAAEVALVASLEDTDVLQSRVAAIVRERERLHQGLKGLPGVRVWPSWANFVLCRFPPGEAVRMKETLARLGIIVRYFDRPRLRDCLRFSVGRPEDNDRLLEALRKLL
ncbi:MAG: histidinol-phosphate transaminase [Chloroflexi bacterium]|nr:histidinol-phosphate transaminase [Chloroflexota bacterium]